MHEDTRGAAVPSLQPCVDGTVTLLSDRILVAIGGEPAPGKPHAEVPFACDSVLRRWAPVSVKPETAEFAACARSGHATTSLGQGRSLLVVTGGEDATGVLLGDMIVRVNETSVSSNEDLLCAIEESEPDQPLTLTVMKACDPARIESRQHHAWYTAKSPAKWLGSRGNVPVGAYVSEVSFDIESVEGASLSMQYSVDNELRSATLNGRPVDLGRSNGFRKHGGTMVIINGPRFSTRAESTWYRKMGWSVVNMTGAPEAVLAAEAGLPYATMALVTDYDAGVDGHEPVTMNTVMRVMNSNIDRLRTVLEAAVPAIT